MSNRRIVSSSLSARIVSYLGQRGYSQAKIARMLGVSEPFISLVKSKERGLTLDHLERLSLALSVPLGALLLSVTPPPRKASKPVKEFFASSERLLKRMDDTREAILQSSDLAVRRRRAS